MDQLFQIPGNYSWDGNSGYQTFFNNPTATISDKQIQFETLFVATNYMNSGKDLIIGSIQWGYDNHGTVKTGSSTGKIVFQPSVSQEALDIINFDYPGYEFFK